MDTFIDLEKVRRDTPHCQDKIFFNSAGSSLPPVVVNQVVIDYLQEEEKIGGYAVAEKRKDQIQTFYSEAASLINARSDQIAFTSHATDSFARALSSVQFEKGDYILTTIDDYISNQIAFLSLKERIGVEILRADVDANGILDLERLEDMILMYQPKLICVTHVPTSSGLIQDAGAVGKLCNQYGVLYLVDACQSIGQMPVDVQALKCDFLSVTGRKFLRGPRGTGFLYVSDRVLEEKLTPLIPDMRGAKWVERDEIRLHAGARRFEYWEQSYALLVGLTEAVKYANQIGLENIFNYNQQLSKKLREGLDAIPGVTTHDLGEQLCSIVTFRKEGMKVKELKAYLQSQNVYFSITTKFNALIDLERKGIDWVIRLSPHYFNTKEEVDKLLDIVDQAGK